VETQKGKAWNKPLDLEIRDNKSYKTVKKILMAPNTPRSGSLKKTRPSPSPKLAEVRYSPISTSSGKIPVLSRAAIFLR
jgi:hypothetical protein